MLWGVAEEGERKEGERERDIRENEKKYIIAKRKE